MMTLTALKTLVATGTVTLCAAALLPFAAQAQTWNYSLDSFSDGTGGLIRDGINYNSNGRVTTGTAAHGVGLFSQYEHFGMAYTATNDTVTFAFNSNHALTGWAESRAADGNIGWGDFFLNLDSSLSFEQAKAQGKVLGIRFAGTNDSGVAAGETGIFSGITTMNVTQTNAGWSSYSQYNNYVNSQIVKVNGQTVGTGQVQLIDGMTVTEAQNYLGAHGHSVIKTYDQKVGDITLLDYAQLSAMDLDFGSQAPGQTMGTQTFGFSFARSLLPGGELNWMAHVMAECANDTMGTGGTFAAVSTPSNPGTPGNPDKTEAATPEPGTIIGSIAALMSMMGYKKRQQAKRNG
ncbi:MAG: PEP-CTERM sorting domain-containing protein [Spirulina sp. DLM2.Bin59]|nr:MAG: PEP-CTERM sorting domain-containing protein [Spirulina sp. DLM2.Bin59]